MSYLRAAEATAPPVIGEADIRLAIDPVSFQRGARYQRQGRVGELEVHDGGRLLIGEVVGNAPRPYSVEVAIGVDSRGVRIRGDCSCPVGFNCKHVGAVLFEWLGQQRQWRPDYANGSSDPLDGPVGEWLRSLARAANGKGEDDVPERVIYILSLSCAETQPRISVQPCIVRPLKSGGYSRPKSYGLDTLATSTARFIRPDDVFIGRQIGAVAGGYSGPSATEAEIADLVLRRMVATGRCHWRSVDNPPLRQGGPRPAKLTWRVAADGRQIPGIEADGLVPLPGASPWYVDEAEWEAGPLSLGLPPMVVAAVLRAPPIAPAAAAKVRDVLGGELSNLSLPLPCIAISEQAVVDDPVPVLHLATYAIDALDLPRWYGGLASGDATVDVATLRFDYSGTIVDPASEASELRRVDGNRVVIHRRNRDFERAAQRRLAGLGLGALHPVMAQAVNLDGEMLAFSQPRQAEAWAHLLHREVARLREAGWRVDIERDFAHDVIDAGGDWQIDVDDRSDWWFSLDLGIDIDGERLPLLPVLVDAVRRLRGTSPEEAAGALERIAKDGTLYSRLADGRVIALPVERVRTILATLVELFDADSLSPDGKLSLSMGHAANLAELEEALRLRWLGGERLRDLAHRLRDFSGIAPAPVPESFGAVLRPYQQSGVDWLQFLREYELGGILADDMGLGKTVQALAHIAIEKHSGRLDRPCLVVAPTSVVPNWKAEATRFTPHLRLLALHGSDRAGRFAGIDKADIVLTTYPLLLRDHAVLTKRAWHLVVLDEAQAIKNPQAKVSQVACRLDARHRLCLSGTPIENHLGELWSLFAFLIPGVLGDSKRFARLFRTPIEKNGDAGRRDLLARRVRPFVLRRTKAEVAADLPEKIEIVRRVELAGDQRDLYETVRLAMDERVRSEIAAKGLARSHIIVLDALLKLRQACCDPRLVKLPAARKAKSSAKLELLTEMLPELIEEGRRVLLFSQFTSMLELIKEALAPLKIPYVEITGATGDRATPVARFQAGEVPLFLISLKAGGTGLNLTAADTVIHYDPWWNPAVENQATDRAHRIGQDKTVFVYKLIALGTVEERILDLQARKQALTGIVQESGGAAGASLDASDLDALFEPLR